MDSWLTSCEPLPAIVEASLRFRLTYSGPLIATQGGTKPGEPPSRAMLKHEIRRCFHTQLRWHWDTNAFLSTDLVSRVEYGLPATLRPSGDTSDRVPLRDAVAAVHHQGLYAYVPLVKLKWKVLCELEVLLLRHDPPGSVVSAGDVDNRVKTLVDALTIPKPNQLAGNEIPRADEVPFYCLLEDDVLVSRLSVETDRLLLPSKGKQQQHQQEVHAVITVTVRPYSTNLFNIGFWG